jgi:hypothetical protein
MRRSLHGHLLGGRQRAAAAALALTVVIAAAVAAQAAEAATFERGDTLASVGADPAHNVAAHIERFAPDGTSKGALAGSSGAGPLCFDASGEHLVAPRAGLFDNTGTLLASDWSSVATPGNACAVDIAGNVYVAGGATDLVAKTGTIRKFDLTGHLLTTYTVDASGPTYGHAVTNLDLAPDQCTIFYTLDGAGEVKRYNACTNTPGASLPSGFPCDGLRVRANGDVVLTCDTFGELLSPAGGDPIQRYANPIGKTSLRLTALDSDGTSFWMGAYGGEITRFDIASGQQLGLPWSAGSSLSGLVVYSPPAAPSNPGDNPPVSAPPAAAPAPAPSQAASLIAPQPAPSLVAGRARLTRSGATFVLDTGVRATCPAGGERCRATVVLTVAVPGARAAALHRNVRVGRLTMTIAPGSRARLAVRLTSKGARLLRKLRSARISIRTSIRAGSGRALVKTSSVRVRVHARPPVRR